MPFSIKVQWSHRAMALVRRAIHWKALRPPHHFLCVDCGNPALYYDHRNYAQPLRVEPENELLSPIKTRGKYRTGNRT